MQFAYCHLYSIPLYLHYPSKIFRCLNGVSSVLPLRYRIITGSPGACSHKPVCICIVVWYGIIGCYIACWIGLYGRSMYAFARIPCAYVGSWIHGIYSTNIFNCRCEYIFTCWKCYQRYKCQNFFTILFIILFLFCYLFIRKLLSNLHYKKRVWGHFPRSFPIFHVLWIGSIN